MIIVHSLFPNEEDAVTAARELVVRGLCASVSVLPAGSTYHLQESNVIVSSDHLCLCTTTEAAYGAVESVLRALHQDPNAAIFAVAASAVSEMYRQLLDRSVQAH